MLRARLRGVGLGVVLVTSAVLLPAPAAAVPAPVAAPAVAVVPLPPDVRLPAGAALVGRWRIAGGAEPAVVWRAPRPLPVTDARPELRVGDAVVAVPTLAADSRSLSVPAAELAGVRTGRLQVWLGADRLDRAGAVAPSLRSGAGGPSSDGIAGGGVDVLDVDPGEPGPYEPEQPFYYRAAGLPWDEYPAPLEVLGQVVLPEGVDDAPLVLFLHGRHQPCYRPRGDGDGGGDVARGGDAGWPCPGASRPVPSHLGYTYVQRLLASQGYATVSIAANAINAQDFLSPDGGAAARSALVRHHLGLIADRAADPGAPAWFGRVDVANTVLVGHSRGGEGVARATVDTPSDAWWDITGQVLIAPTNFGSLGTPYTPSVTLLPYCDGDVIDLQGQQFTDVPRDLTADDSAPRDTALRSSVLMRGANHNFFNTEWTPGISVAPSFDDWFDDDHPVCGDDTAFRLSAGEQREAGRAWIAGAVRLFAAGDETVLPMYDARRGARVESAPAEVVRTHALGGDRTLLRPRAELVPTGAAEYCSGTRSGSARLPSCGEGAGGVRELHWTENGGFFGFSRIPPRHVRMVWRRPGPVGGLEPADPIDLSAPGSTLDLRTIADPEQPPMRVRVRLTDADGDRWTSPQQLLPRLVGDFIRSHWAHTLRVDPTAAPARLDRSAIDSIQLVAESAPGRAWVLDAAVRREALVPVPDARLPVVSLARRTVVDEGDAAGASAEIAYTLDEPAPRPARLVAQVSTQDGGEPTIQRLVEDIAAGATAGTLEVPYVADQADDPPRRVLRVQAVAVRNAVMGQRGGRLDVRDDDPDPVLSVDPARRAVDAGERMQFVLRLDRPTTYRLSVLARGVVTEPDAANLRVGDVPARWARRNLGRDRPPGSPVARWLAERVEIARGERRAVLVVPTRERPPEPGARTLTVRFRSGLLPDGPVLVTIRRR